MGIGLNAGPLNPDSKMSGRYTPSDTGQMMTLQSKAYPGQLSSCCQVAPGRNPKLTHRNLKTKTNKKYQKPKLKKRFTTQTARLTTG